MGYHADTYTGLKALIEAAAPTGCEVVDGLSLTDAQATRLACAVVIVRESIDYAPHPEINPDTAVADQYETWRWSLYVIGGGGASTPTSAATHVDTLLETLRTALNAQRPTSSCGPLHLTSEEYQQPHGAGVIYAQRWTHDRLA